MSKAKVIVRKSDIKKLSSTPDGTFSIYSESAEQNITFKIWCHHKYKNVFWYDALSADGSTTDKSVFKLFEKDREILYRHFNNESPKCWINIDQTTERQEVNILLKNLKKIRSDKEAEKFLLGVK